MGEVKRFTLAEVSANNGRNNSPVWIVYRDAVYDVTSYVDQHPGSPDPILEEAGKDATKAFDDVGHSSDARTIIAKYKIGEIVEEEKKIRRKRQEEKEGSGGCTRGDQARVLQHHHLWTGGIEELPSTDEKRWNFTTKVQLKLEDTSVLKCHFTKQFDCF